jgi:hypothetical protein
MLHLEYNSSTFLAAALAVLLWSPTALAFDGFCEPADEAADKPAERSSTTSLREKASRFAPRLQIRVWFEPSDDRRAREQARSSALTQGPHPAQPDPLRPDPVQNSADYREPYGWQVSVRWDLVEMAEAMRPNLAESSDRLLPTECLENQTMARRLLLEDGLTDDDLLEEQGEEQ